MAVVAVLALAGCTSGDTDGPPEDTPAQGETTGAAQGETTRPEATTTEIPALPVGEPFAEPVWGFEFASHGTATTAPVVTRDRLVVLSGPALLAYDATGEQVWSATPDVLESDIADPILRVVDENVVALISQGESTGEGLDVDVWAARVTLWSLDSGDEIASIDVAGTESDGPHVSRFGLAFVLPDGSGLVVRPDGSTEDVAEAGVPWTGASGEWAEEIAVVGDTVLQRGEDSAYSAQGGAWDTSVAAPADATATDIRGVIGTDAIVVRWYSGQGAEGEESGAVLDASTGEVLAPVEGCMPPVAEHATVSPSGDYAVLDGLLWDGSTVTCIGGGDGQREVALTAITDDGTAYGRAEGDLLVEVPASGEPTTSDLPEGALPPIGLMDGDLAIHYDPDGVITANPVG